MQSRRAVAIAWAAWAACAASACSEPPAGPPAGEACRYLGQGVEDGETPPAADDCHFVATLNPLSGGLAAVGLALENAARLAVRDVNAVGPVGGKKMCLVGCDSRTDPTTVDKTVRSVISSYSIVALNGAAESASSLVAAAVTGPAGIAQVSCCSTSPELTNDPKIYRTVPSDALQGVVLANLARELPEPAERVAVIYVDDTYGQSLKDVFLRAFTTLSGTVTRAVPYQPRASGYLPVITQALTPEPDHVLLVAFPTDGAQIMRDWRTSGLAQNVRWLATDGLKDPKFVVGAGAAARAVTVIGTAPLLRGKHFASFERRYKEAFGNETPGIFTSNQYDAMMLIAMGIARGGAGAQSDRIRDLIREVARAPGTEVSPDDVAKAITTAAAEDVDYSGASGELEMDDKGDVVSEYRVWQVSGASVVDTDACWGCDSAPTGVRCRKRAGCSVLD